MILPSAQAAIELIARVVLDPGDVAWMESPGYGGARAALEAVKQWVYQPTLLNGQPVEVIAPIDVNFTLGQ